MTTKAIRVKVEGRVQGVGFRAWTVSQATRLGLDGWVRNCPDGTVEAVISGEAGSVDQMLSLIGLGPEAADVTDIFVEPAEGELAEPGFRTVTSDTGMLEGALV